MSGPTVEFLGPPAAGKTTLARAVADRLDRAGTACNAPGTRIADRPAVSRVGTKAAFAARYGLWNPGYSLASLRTIHGTDQRTWRDAVRVAFNWQYVCGLASRERPGVTLLDQGLYQALWSVGFRSTAGWSVTDRLVIPATLLPDLLVVVTAPAQTLAARIAHRDGDSRMDDGGDSLVEAVERGIEGVTYLQRRAAERNRVDGRPTCLRVETDATEETTARLVRAIRAVDRGE